MCQYSTDLEKDNKYMSLKYVPKKEQKKKITLTQIGFLLV